MKPQHKPAATLALLGAAIVLAACGSTAGSTVAIATNSTIATVGSGAACIPDLQTTHISLVPLRPGGATGVIPSTDTAQQVRMGAVPAPPNAQLVTSGSVIAQSGAAANTLPPLGQPSVHLYQTSCDPGDVQAYYVAALSQNQWAGGFVPASGAAKQSRTTTSDSSTSGPVTGNGVTLFDLAALATGRFVNIHPGGDAVAFITVLAAIEAPGTPQERHPTFVQIIVQPGAGTAGTPMLSPAVATTPNVGASAAPPSTPAP